MDTTDGARGRNPDDALTVVGSLCRNMMEAPAYQELDGVAVSRCSGTSYAGVLYASSPLASDLEALQETLGEGPGPSALTLRSPMLLPDLMSDPRARAWVTFVSEAVRRGVSSMFSFPVQVGAVGLGLLTFHGRGPTMLDEPELRDILKLSDAIALAMLAPEIVDWPADGVAGLDGEHAVTHQAVGMVSVQLGTTLEDAIVALRAHAFAEGTTLVETARAVVARRLSFRDRGENGSSGAPGTERGTEGGSDDGDR